MHARVRGAILLVAAMIPGGALVAVAVGTGYLRIEDLGLDIPNIQNIQLSVPMGQLALFGGEQQLFAPGHGFNVRFAIEDSYQAAGGFPAFPGIAIDFLATRGRGVSYGLTVPRSADNSVNAYASSYPGQAITRDRSARQLPGAHRPRLVQLHRDDRAGDAGDGRRSQWLRR